MARRLIQTPADFLILAISPALIMLLVGSLVFFLAAVFYQGEYLLRLSFILAMFVMATVCVARIAMEEGAAYASFFGAPLALVTLVAMVSFVQMSGVLAPVSWMVNVALISLVWWCAHKLTWDCTLIDDSQDASGQGLLQIVGLDGQAEGDAPPKAKRSLWDRWFGEKKNEPHAPGVWVVYFSLAALPLFGVLQWFIPAADAETRRYTFWLLLIYVASGLALLLSTSFLGLRRYLRQRQLEMPADMAVVWVSVGSMMIVVLLVVCLLLPRPGAEYAVSRLPFEFTSGVKKPSKYGVGNDGPQDDRYGKRTGPQSEQGGTQGSAKKGSQDSTQNKDASGQGSQNSDSKGNGSEKSQNSDGGKSGDGDKQGQGSQQDKSQGQGSNSEKNSSGSKSGQSSGERQGSQQQNSQQQNSQQAQSQSSSNASQQASSPPPPQSTRSWSINPWGILGFLGWLLKLAIYVVVACAVGYFAWRYRAEIMAAAKKFMDELRALWERFFGRKAAAAAAAQAEPPKPREKRFADFADPFASGLAGRYTVAELVRYTFEAVEAWGREHNCAREPHQTPHEFAEQLAKREVALAKSAGILAELYCRAAYAAGALPNGSLQHLQQLWQTLRPV